MEPQPGVMRVTATEKADVLATSVKFHVVVKGEKLLFGNAALEKSQDVRALVDDLKVLGAQDKDFEIKSITSRSNSGIFGKDSRVEYHLVVKQDDLSMVGEFLGAISDRPGTVSSSLEWVFDDDSVVADLAARALVKAKIKAQKMAQAVEQKILGISACSDTWSMPEVYYDALPSAPAQQSLRAKASDMKLIDVGTEFKATKPISVTVTVDFFISGL